MWQQADIPLENDCTRSTNRKTADTVNRCVNVCVTWTTCIDRHIRIMHLHFFIGNSRKGLRLQVNLNGMLWIDRWGTTSMHFKRSKSHRTPQRLRRRYKTPAHLSHNDTPKRSTCNARNLGPQHIALLVYQWFLQEGGQNARNPATGKSRRARLEFVYQLIFKSGSVLTLNQFRGSEPDTLSVIALSKRVFSPLNCLVKKTL